MSSPTSRSRSATDVVPADEVATLAGFPGMAAGASMAPMGAAITATAWRRALALQAETARFTARRLERTAAAWGAMASAREPGAAFSAWSAAAQEARADMAEQAQRVAKIMVASEDELTD